MSSPLSYLGTPDASTTIKGKVELATVAETIAGTRADLAITPAGAAGLITFGAPAASTTQAGIIELADNAEAAAQTMTDRAITPSNLPSVFAAPGAIGGTTPGDAEFSGLVVDSTAAITLDSDAASNFSVDGAGIDLTLASAAGRVIINAEEAAANAVTILSAAGGLDVDTALLLSLTSSRNHEAAIEVVASAGGINVTAAGAAGEDIDIVNTAGSVNISAGEAAADSIVLSSASGGMDVTVALDLDVTCSSGVLIQSTESQPDSIRVISTAGGIDILASGAAAGEDIDIVATGSSVNIQSTESHVDAIVINASGAAGGINADAGTSGVIVDTTGAISLDSAAASNFTVTGAFDLTVSTTAGSLNLSAGEAAADAVNVDSTGGFDLDAALQININSAQNAATAIVVNASHAGGGIDIDCGTTGIAIDSTGAFSIDGAAASNVTTTGAGIDLTLASVLGSVLVSSTEDAALAIRLHANGGTSETIQIHSDQGTGVASVGLLSDVGGITIRATGLNTDDAINIEAAAGGIDIDSAGEIDIVTTEANADSINVTSGGGIDLTATGAAGKDIDIVCTSGSLNLTAGESAADSMVITNNGMDIAISGAAGRDFDLTNTGGSVNITATENVSDAIVITASGAASGVTIDAGTLGVTLGTGLKVPVTARATAGGTYTILGTDYFITTDSTGGAFQVNLPAVPVTGQVFVVYDGAGQAATGGNITISGNGNNIAAGGTSAATKLINTAYESYILTWDGTVWCGQNIV